MVKYQILIWSQFFFLSLASLVAQNQKIIGDISSHFGRVEYIIGEKALVPEKTFDNTIRYSIVNYWLIPGKYERNLGSSWQWMCFPRLERNGAGYGDVIETLEKIEPMPENLLFRHQDNATGDVDDDERIGNAWNTPLPFEEINSSNGYKLNIQEDQLFLLNSTGSIASPGLSFPLYSGNGRRENWIGYFLTYSQEALDAFGGIENKLTFIQTQDWTMVKEHGEWVIPNNVTPLSYGDMVIVKVTEDIPTFSWILDQEAEESDIRETEYYTFVEQETYTPFYVEIYSAVSGNEVAVMAQDECRGASVISDGDTLIEVNGYLSGLPSGTPLTFEIWDGYKSSATKKKEYLVRTPGSNSQIQRTIYSGEGIPYYNVSFGSQDIKTNTDIESMIEVFPNPALSEASIRFVADDEAAYDLMVTDFGGKPIHTLIRGTFPGGITEVEWNLTDGNNRPLKNGIYLIRLTKNSRNVANEKIVIIR